MSEETGGKIYGLLVQAMQKIPSMPKTERPASGPSYLFRGIDGIRNVIHPLFAELGIFIAPEVLETQVNITDKGVHTHQRICFHFYADDGSNVGVTAEGESIDARDKSCQQAASFAEKTAYISMFALETGEGMDNELRGGSDSPDPAPRRSATPPPAANVQNAQAQDGPVSVDEITARKAILGWTDAKLTVTCRNIAGKALEDLTADDRANVYAAMVDA